MTETFELITDWIFGEIDKRAPGLPKLERYAAYQLVMMAHDNFADAGATKQVDATIWMRGQQNLIEEVLREPLLLKVLGAYHLEQTIFEESIPGGPLERAIDQALETIRPLVAMGSLTPKGLEMFGFEGKA